VLGIEPFDVANEGKVVFGVAPDDAEAVLEALRDHPKGEDAAIIGEAVEEHAGRVVLDTGFGRRYLPEPEGEQLPRIC
jgi:hydrogenase expression/formation protein HypE